jgi:hypothetical protein
VDKKWTGQPLTTTTTTTTRDGKGLCEKARLRVNGARNRFFHRNIDRPICNFQLPQDQA